MGHDQRMLACEGACSYALAVSPLPSRPSLDLLDSESIRQLDPVATGSVKASSVECVVCGQSRGYIYTGPVYATEKDDNEICPWCIADGSAADRLDAQFTDVGWGVPDDVPAAACEEIAQRTPGFVSWQQDHWLYHCADGCAFLGAVGRRDLDDCPDALEVLLHENDQFGWIPEQSQRYVDSLDADGQPTAYLFSCLHCGVHLAFSDST
jgi:uncharacterized protein CbrC (UPF0167 family)